jgi:hypothetical protein
MLTATEKRRFLVADFRFSEAKTRDAWSDDRRREQYLLRTDVTVPISADPRVTMRTEDPSEVGSRIAVIAQGEDQEGEAKSTFQAAFCSFPTIETFAESEFLGFDVCDCDLYSALLNCGYVHQSNPTDPKPLWGSALTERHLLRHLEDAKAVREAADARVAAHAPFFILRVFRHG